MVDFLVKEFSLQNVSGQVMWAILISSVVRVWIWFWGKPLEKRKELIFWILCPLSGFVIVALLSRLPTSFRPDLHGTIISMAVTFQDSNPASQVIVVFANISNTGSPSTVDQWSLSAKSPGQDAVRVPGPIEIPEQMTISGSTRDEAFTFHASDDLPNKVAETPIQTGATAKGIIFFQPSKFVGDALSAGSGMELILSYTDVTGKRYNVHQSATLSKVSLRAPFAGIPGLKSKRLVTPPAKIVPNREDQKVNERKAP
jgi:hypothetical protein